MIQDTHQVIVKCERYYKKIPNHHNMEANAEFKCEICDQQYSAKHSLKRHFDSVHGNKNFQCNICTKKFLNSGNLKIHMDKVQN